MARKKYTAEQIIAKLREAEIALAKGLKTPQVCKQLGISDQTYYRWRKEYGGLRVDQAKRLKQLEQERVLKAEEHHVIKTKDFDVYGKLRQDQPYVKATQKSQAQSELNEKFITTECITDRRVKISSMANR